MTVDIMDGRQELYQYDTGRRLLITDDDGAIDSVHFEDLSDAENPQAYVVPVEEDEFGNRFAPIPNACLANESTKLVAYTVDVDGETSQATTRRYVFKVIRRQKPLAYDFPPDRVATVDTALASLRDAVRDANIAVGKAEAWATRTGSPVEGDLNSAKQYAIDAYETASDFDTHVGTPSDAPTADTVYGAINKAVKEAKEEIKNTPGLKGDPGEDGVSVTHRWDGTRLTITSASGTSSADLKGIQGNEGQPGPRGERGEQGLPGRDGQSIHHEWEGTSLILVSASGTTRTNLKGDTGSSGPKGDPGEKGEDGKDYILTEADKTEIADKSTTELRGEVTALTSSLTELDNRLSESIVEIVKSTDEHYSEAFTIHMTPSRDTSGTLVNKFYTPFPSGTYLLEFETFQNGLMYAFQNASGQNLDGGDGTMSGNRRAFVHTINAQMSGIGYYCPKGQIASEYDLGLKVTKITEETSNKPSAYCWGDGSRSDNYASKDNKAGFGYALSSCVNGGKVNVKSGCYLVGEPIVVDGNCINIEGDIWNYPSHPNGVYESYDGTKLKPTASAFPIMKFANGNGIRISQLGFNGIVSNGNTKGRFNYSNPSIDCGLELTTPYSDQFEFERLSFTGLACGIVANKSSAQLDAFIIDRINADGCDVGMYFNIGSAIYGKIKDCIVADNPAHGFYFKGSLSGSTISGMVFVRNGGGYSDTQKTALGADNLCAVYINKLNKSKFINNVIHNSGTYHDTTQSAEGTWEYQNASGLIFNSASSEIRGNDVSEAQNYSAVFGGDYNTYRDNSFTGNNGVIINGSYNLFYGNSITARNNTTALTVNGNSNKIMALDSEGTIVLNGNNNIVYRQGYEKVIVSAGSKYNKLFGFDANQITDNGEGTRISLAP